MMQRTRSKQEVLDGLGVPDDLKYLRREKALRIDSYCHAHGIKIEARKVEGQWEVFAETGKLTDDMKREIKTCRDELVRDIWMRAALSHLSRRGVEYVPLDVEEDVNLSHDHDDLDTFRETLRGWVVELVRSAA